MLAVTNGITTTFKLTGSPTQPDADVSVTCNVYKPGVFPQFTEIAFPVVALNVPPPEKKPTLGSKVKEFAKGVVKSAVTDIARVGATVIDPLEQAITGVQSITMTDANYTLTSFNGVVDEARNAVLIFTGTLSQQRNVIAPLVEKIYTIRNNTTGGYGIQIIGASGTGVVIPNGVTASVYCDGTNFNPLQVNSIGNQTINGNLTVTGTTSLTGNLTATTATFSGTVALGGTPTAPTAAPGTSTTQIATTAFVQNIASSLGTMSQQNANNVAITGGAINGTTIGASNPTTVRGTTGTFTGALSAASGAFSGAVSGTTGTFSGAMSADSLAGNAATGSGASGTWSININGNAATANNH